MKKLITLLAILLFATNLYSSDWKLIESFPFEDASILEYNVDFYSILSSTENSCYVLRNTDDISSSIFPNKSAIYHSTDKGLSWIIQSNFNKSNQTFFYPSFAFSFSAEHLLLPIGTREYVGKIQNWVQCQDYFVGFNRSNDTGKTFSYTYNVYGVEEIQIIQMNDKNRGFCMGNLRYGNHNHVISITNDNWDSSDSIRLTNRNNYYANYRDSENIIIASFRESDNNPTEYFLVNLEISSREITELSATTEFKPDDLFFLNSERGFATNSTSEEDKAVIYKTNDGGKSWTTVYNSSELIFYYKDCGSRIRFEFYDENNGIIPYLGGILMTRDGGETWTASPIETEVSTRNITATWVGNSIIADGRDGKLYRYQGDFFDIPLGTAEPALPVCNTLDNKLPVKLEWIPAGMATHYRLQVSKFEDFSDIDLFEDAINNNYFAISQLDSGVTYHWRVQPYNSKEEGEWSESCSFTVVYPSSVTDGDSRFSVYPNPTRDILHIRTDELISRAELSDVLGNVVKIHTSDVFETSDVLKLNVENLPAGMYFLKLYTMSGEVLVEKVMVGF